MNRPSLKIAIATYDLKGPIRNGGIGTAYFGLSKLLASQGHDVTILYLLRQECEDREIEHWIEWYRNEGVRLVPLPEFPQELIALPPAAISFEAYRWLKHGDFDVIHFHDWRGAGFYSTVAKKQGLAFSNTVLAVTLHAPSLWALESDGPEKICALDLATDFMERKSVEDADVVFSPSRFLTEWIAAEGWLPPPEIRIVQNIFYPQRESESESERFDSEPASGEERELVFFGRLENRKGLRVFCDAIDALATELSQKRIKIVFLGKNTELGNLDAHAFLRTRAEKWAPATVDFRLALSSGEAIAYLKSRRALAVIPSLAENSPYTVLECLHEKIPFLAADRGGIAELIAPEDRTRVLFEPRPAPLTEKIREALAKDRWGVPAAQPARSAYSTRVAWSDWHAQVAIPGGGEEKPSLPVRLTVCLASRNRPQFLQHALRAIQDQDYPAFDLILVDDGSDQPAALDYLSRLESEFAARGWRIFRRPHRYPGAARNFAARHARTDYLLLVDDDNEIEPFQFSLFSRIAMRTGADLVTGAHHVSYESNPDGTIRRTAAPPLWLPLGGAVAAGLFSNWFGDTNMLIKKSVFEKLGGFTEDFGVGNEDWELLAKAALAGHRIEAVPEPATWYRRHSASVTDTTPRIPGLARVARPYLEKVPIPLRSLIRFAQMSEAARGENFFSDSACSDRRGRAADETQFLSLAGETVLRCDPGTGFGGIEVWGASAIADDGKPLELRAHSADPNLLLPQVETKPAQDFFLRVDLTVPTATTTELFYLLPGQAHYSPDRKISRRLKGGRNCALFRISGREGIVGRVRLDPGDVTGVYRIHDLEVRLVEPDREP